MDSRKPKVAIIGAGALGRALGYRLSEKGYWVAAILSRSEARAQALAKVLDVSIGSASLHDLPAEVTLVFCCVPDDTIGAVGRSLSRVRPVWSGTTVAHTSGALTASALYGLHEQGAALLSFHPLQTFTPSTPSSAFEGIFVGLEGDSAAVALGAQVAEDLGAHPLRLSPQTKTRYHLAATLASNYLVTLMALADEVLADTGIDASQHHRMLRPLVEGTWSHLLRQPPEQALTGPIVRGDDQTLMAHLECLVNELPHLLPIYAALGTETVRLALRGDRLAPDKAQALLDQIHKALAPYKDPPF